jgi:hypothetical protein
MRNQPSAWSLGLVYTRLNPREETSASDSAKLWSMMGFRDPGLHVEKSSGDSTHVASRARASAARAELPTLLTGMMICYEYWHHITAHRPSSAPSMPSSHSAALPLRTAEPWQPQSGRWIGGYYRWSNLSFRGKDHHLSTFAVPLLKIRIHLTSIVLVS